MVVLMTGGTGFIGSRVVNALLEQEHDIILFCRNPAKAFKLFGNRVGIVHRFRDINVPVDAVINLAGEPIIGSRWTKKRKHQLIASRVEVTRHLNQWLAKQDSLPEVLISGSAIGYYGNYPEDEPLTEDAHSRSCFPSTLCQDWEFEALKATAVGVRVCLLRTGVVLDKSAGALKKMWLPFSMGLGGEVASGKQWFSWIHHEDMVRLILFALHNKAVKGPVNATAPHPVTYGKFTRTLAQVLSRPHIVPMPSWLLSLLFGEAAQLLTQGQKVIPKALLDTGFEFRFARIADALENITQIKNGHSSTIRAMDSSQA